MSVHPVDGSGNCVRLRSIVNWTQEGPSARLSSLMLKTRWGELSVGLVPAVSITTAYRKVPTSPGTGSYGSGQYFKIGLGVIDKTRPFILQAIETIILLPTTLAKGAPRSGIPLATYKTRLLLSPITVPEDK
mmetsp:Transcript_34708/g.68482  ORF Transcript_34708/g.68482 Transcript_34708/m.68482 type:complete len:132 (-) Transcript_34708:156-551(-)